MLWVQRLSSPVAYRLRTGLPGTSSTAGTPVAMVSVSAPVGGWNLMIQSGHRYCGMSRARSAAIVEPGSASRGVAVQAVPQPLGGWQMRVAAGQQLPVPWS